MQLNQVPTQFVGGEQTALETQIAERTVMAMPEEPPQPILAGFANLPQPIIWIGALALGLWLLGGLGGRRRT